jgi:hypothetical protein
MTGAATVSTRGWRRIERYTYVARPFDAVWSWLAGHLSTLGHPLEGGGRSVELRIRPGGREISRPVRLQVSGLVCDEDRATSAIGWADATHPRLFPELHAILEVPCTQLGILARYRPPLGPLGSIGDRLIGAEVTDVALTTLLEELARAAEGALEPQPPEPTGRAPDLEEPTLRRLFLTVDGLALRPGGAAGAAESLEALPGVTHVSLNPLAGFVVVDHDPARCGLDQMRAVFEDETGTGSSG